MSASAIFILDLKGKVSLRRLSGGEVANEAPAAGRTVEEIVSFRYNVLYFVSETL